MVGGCTHGYIDRCPCCGTRFFSNSAYAGTTTVNYARGSYASNVYGSTIVEEFKEAAVAALMFLQDLDLVTVPLDDLFCHWLPPPAQLHARKYRRAARTRQPRRFSRYRKRS